MPMCVIVTRDVPARFHFPAARILLGYRTLGRADRQNQG